MPALVWDANKSKLVPEPEGQGIKTASENHRV